MRAADSARVVHLCAARCAPFVAHKLPTHALRLTQALAEKVMSRPKPLLDKLASQGKPLAEVGVIPINDNDSELIADILDSLAPDISAAVRPAYLQPTEKPTIFQIQMEATKEALLREFGWELTRKKIYDTAEHNGKYPDGYMWDEKSQPKFYPLNLAERIKELGLIQPGNSDNGLIDDVQYQYDPTQ